MAKYKVVLVRAKTLYETTTVEVEADNQRKARRLATTKAHSDPTVKWEPDTYNHEGEVRTRVRDWQRLSSEALPKAGR